MTGPVTDFSLSILRITRDDYRKLTHDQRQRLHVYAGRSWEEDSMTVPDRFRDGAGEAILCFEVASYRIDEIMQAGEIKLQSQILLKKDTHGGSYVELFDDGRRALAAHFGFLAQLDGTGPITSESIGPASRSYAALMTDDALSMTPAGLAYRSLYQTLPTVFGFTG